MAKIKTDDKDSTLDVKGEETPKSPKSAKTTVIGIDITTEMMLKLQTDGFDLLFETDLGKFKKLSLDEVAQLNQNNKTRYFVAVGMHQQKVEESDDPFAGLDIKIDGKAYSATESLEVFGKDPNFHYVWKSPEKLQRAVRDGLIPARDPNLKTSYGSGSEVRKIGAYGKDELILCKQPKDLHVKYEKDIEERSRRMIEATKQEGVNEIAKAGKVYIPPEDGSDDSRFTKANPDRR